MRFKRKEEEAKKDSYGEISTHYISIVQLSGENPMQYRAKLYLLSRIMVNLEKDKQKRRAHYPWAELEDIRQEKETMLTTALSRLQPAAT